MHGLFHHCYLNEIVGLQVTKRPYFMQMLKLIRVFKFFHVYVTTYILSMCLKTIFSLNWSKIISNAIL